MTPRCRNPRCRLRGREIRQSGYSPPRRHCFGCGQTTVQKSEHVAVVYDPLPPAFWVAARRETERLRVVAEATRKERESRETGLAETKRPRRERTDGFFVEKGE